MYLSGHESSPLDRATLADTELGPARAPEASPRTVLPVLDFAHLTTEHRGDMPELRSRSFPVRRRNHVNDVREIPLSLAQPKDGLRSDGDRVMSVLLNSCFRRRNLDELDTHVPTLRATVERSLERKEPLQLVLLMMAAKSPNPLATGNPIGHTDPGEHLFFAQVRNLIRSIEQVHPYSARFGLPDAAA